MHHSQQDIVAAKKAELRQYVRDNFPDIQSIKEDSDTRILAEILESEVPGRGVELAVKICEQLGGRLIYLYSFQTLITLARNQWIRTCGLSRKILVQVTGLSSMALYNIESVDFDQLKLPGFGGDKNAAVRDGDKAKGIP